MVRLPDRDSPGNGWSKLPSFGPSDREPERCSCPNHCHESRLPVLNRRSAVGYCRQCTHEMVWKPLAYGADDAHNRHDYEHQYGEQDGSQHRPSPPSGSGNDRQDEQEIEHSDCPSSRRAALGHVLDRRDDHAQSVHDELDRPRAFEGLVADLGGEHSSPGAVTTKVPGATWTMSRPVRHEQPGYGETSG